MKKINVINFMNSDKHVINFLTKHALVNLVERKKLTGVDYDISDYFHNLISIIDFNLNTKDVYIVIKYVDKFYRLCGVNDGISIEFIDWCEVKITSAEIKYTWGIL